jgi:hypothetical protein
MIDITPLNSLETDGKHLTNIQAFKMSKIPQTTDNRKKEFVYMQQDYMLAFEQVKNKHQMGKHMI